MQRRRPQINFQVDTSMKRLYEEARAHGHWVTRLCAAGLLLMIEDAGARQAALSRLREWETKYERASLDQIRDFVAKSQGAMQAPSRGSRPGPKARGSRKAAGRE